MTTYLQNYLANKLIEAVKSPDHESMMDRCDQMYSSKFHSGQPFRAGDRDEDDLRSYGFTFDAENLVPPTYLDWMSEQDDNDDYSVDCYHNWVAQYYTSNILITPDTMLVDVCNYKGEGEGYALWESMQNKPVFRSKNDSFAAFNV